VTVGRYVVVAADNVTVLGGAYKWDPTLFPGWVAPEMIGVPGSKLVLETASNHYQGSVPPVTEVNRQTLADRAAQAIAANATYLAIVSPTPAQVATQVTRLTKECTALARLVLSLYDDTSGT
jgi:hypothetical protein